MIASNSHRPVLIRDQGGFIDHAQSAVEEGQGVDHALIHLDIQPKTAFDREVLRRFCVYLSKIDVPLSLQECWADYQQIYPNLPVGKARWSRILCAVIIILRVRSLSTYPLPLRTLLQIWGVKRSDYFDVLQKMQQIPILRDWITNRNCPHRPTFINISQIMHEVAQSLSINQKLVDSALNMIQHQQCVNRSEIQVLGALLAARELYPQITVVPANDICNVFPHVPKARINALKRHFLTAIKTQPVTTSLSASSFPSHIPIEQETLSTPSKAIGLQANDIIHPQWSYFDLSPSFRSFLLTSDQTQHIRPSLIPVLSGKQINIHQRMFPPPI